MYIFNLNHLTFIESNYDLKHYLKKNIELSLLPYYFVHECDYT